MDAHKVVCPLCCARLKCDRPIPAGQRLRCPLCAHRFTSPAPSRLRPSALSAFRKGLAAALVLILLAGAALAGVLDLNRKPVPNPDEARLTEASTALRQDLERLDAVTRQLAARPEQPAPPATTDGVTELTQGPIHEAFADPANRSITPGPIVPKPPPAPIKEVPPDEKPDGENVQWIPGYWAWDEDQGDYVWVCGCWRAPPPDHRWAPGHWQDVDQGAEWEPGYWAPTDQDDGAYLPAPPDAPAAADEPATPAPDDDYTYDPGCWIYVEVQYVWRPERWIHCLRDRVWVPAHYVETLNGYLFVDGYWDFPLSERGICFAPVRIDPRRDHDRPFRPQRPIDTNHLSEMLPKVHAPELHGGPSARNPGHKSEVTPAPATPTLRRPVTPRPAGPLAEPRPAMERSVAPAVVKPAPAATVTRPSVPKLPRPAPEIAPPRHETPARPSNPVAHTPPPPPPPREPVRRPPPPPPPPSPPRPAQVTPSPRPAATPARASAARRK